jgi:hypothetical protein
MSPTSLEMGLLLRLSHADPFHPDKAFALQNVDATTRPLHSATSAHVRLLCSGSFASAGSSESFGSAGFGGSFASAGFVQSGLAALGSPMGFQGSGLACGRDP